MSETKRQWKARFGHSVEVWREGLDLGPPPQASAAILLLALARRGMEWSDRREVCQRLYPGRPDRAALRQTLLRLRRWLGEGAIEEEALRFRLSPGQWSVEIGDQPLHGLSHPWLLELRSIEGQDEHASSGIQTIGTAFVDALQFLAERDIEGARSMLVSMGALSFHLPPTELERLLFRLRPLDRRDSFATEFYELEANWAGLQGQLQRSIEAFARALRVARHRKHRTSILRVESYLLIALLEAGQMGEAAVLRASRSVDLKAKHAPLIALNAEGMYLWNTGDFAGAVDYLRQVRRQIEAEGRAERLHFLCNFAVLCSEAREFELLDVLTHEAEETFVSDMDWNARRNLELADGLTRAIRNQDPNGLHKLLRQDTSLSLSPNNLRNLYSHEAASEAMAYLGQNEEAKRNWARCVEQRRRIGARLTPRLLIRQKRINSLASRDS